MRDPVLETVLRRRDEARTQAARCETCEAPRLWWHATEIERLYEACLDAKDGPAVRSAVPRDFIVCPQCGAPAHEVPLPGGGSTFPFWCPRCSAMLLDVIRQHEHRAQQRQTEGRAA